MTIYDKEYDVRNDSDRENLFNDLWEEVKDCMENDGQRAIAERFKPSFRTAFEVMIDNNIHPEDFDDVALSTIALMQSKQVRNDYEAAVLFGTAMGLRAYLVAGFTGVEPECL